MLNPNQQQGPGSLLHGPGSFPYQQPTGSIDPAQFLSQAPPGFTGLQGTMPNTQGMDINQLMQLFALTSGAPQRIDQFQVGAQKQMDSVGRSGHSAIDSQANQMFANQAGGLAQGFQQGQQQQLDSMGSAGMAPSIFHQYIQPQQQQQFQTMLGAQRGQSEAGRIGGHQQLRQQQLDQRLGLNQSVLNARNQLEQYYDSLMLQKYLADLSSSTQLKAGNKAASASNTSALLGTVGSLALGGLFSDARLKEDVRTLVDGAPRIVVWRWNKLAGELLGLVGVGVGVIAQELALVAPERVSVGEHGFLKVHAA